MIPKWGVTKVKRLPFVLFEVKHTDKPQVDVSLNTVPFQFNDSLEIRHCLVVSGETGGNYVII